MIFEIEFRRKLRGLALSFLATKVIRETSWITAFSTCDKKEGQHFVRGVKLIPGVESKKHRFLWKYRSVSRGQCLTQTFLKVKLRGIQFPDCKIHPCLAAEDIMLEGKPVAATPQ